MDTARCADVSDEVFATHNVVEKVTILAQLAHQHTGDWKSVFGNGDATLLLSSNRSADPQIGRCSDDGIRLVISTRGCPLIVSIWKVRPLTLAERLPKFRYGYLPTVQFADVYAVVSFIRLLLTL